MNACFFQLIRSFTVFRSLRASKINEKCGVKLIVSSSFENLNDIQCN